jgi:hypothetical protein
MQENLPLLSEREQYENWYMYEEIIFIFAAWT